MTNLSGRSKRVVRFYHGRGTAKQWIKEGKYAVKWTRLSCHDFKDNRVRLPLLGLAYNLGNFLRRLALPRSVEHWPLTALRAMLIKTGARVVRHHPVRHLLHSRGAMARALFAAMLKRIE